jgi:hypothetical protein
MHVTNEYNFKAGELEDKLLPKLIGKVFHVTSFANFEKIEESGHIKTNHDGKLGCTFPQSRIFYGRKKGYVCLFDLRNTNDEEIEYALDRFYFIGDRALGDKQVFLILQPKTYAEFIDIPQAEADLGSNQILWIPDVECWYPDALPLSKIQEIITVNIDRREQSESFKATIRAMEEVLKHKNSQGLSNHWLD